MPPRRRCTVPRLSLAAGRTKASDFEQGVGPPEPRLHDELSDVVDGLAERSSPFVRAVVGVTVNDRLHMLEAVDRLGEPLRAEILENLCRLAFQRIRNRRVVEDGNTTIG